ncbi:hypothetical protein DMB68_08400 [Flavobacterium hydrophilum]|uniref:Uncharacterized protein n=1 Tax=Flavobacterium hydrophilum TaxID=2211445 RepID=A0A2V4CAH7_9FLAO|nr:hypothetical protein DMB68_08400 [Flavobacterium hydrophilum]
MSIIETNSSGAAFCVRDSNRKAHSPTKEVRGLAVDSPTLGARQKKQLKIKVMNLNHKLF